ADEAALRDVLRGLDELEQRTHAMMTGFAAGERTWYSQADNDAVRQLMLSYMNHRTALLRIVWRYQQYEEVHDERLKLRSLLATYTAVNAIYEASLKFVTLFQDAPDAVRKLNEAEPLWGIPAGFFDRVQRSLADPENRRMLTLASQQYREAMPEFRNLGLMESPPYVEFHALIARSMETSARLNKAVFTAATTTPLRDARDASKRAAYKAQSFVSTWVGDTKVRQPRGGKALITPAHVKELRPKLQPGDVLIERRNWFLSNAFLPGYWPHAALYVGTADDLKRLGLDRDPRVQRHWKKFVERDEKKHEHLIIESISEGVVFTSIEHSVGEADSVAVLRPKLAPDQIREAIARGFSHVGKPYDFDFDFFSTDKLVCTELVFRSYDGAINFPLVKVLGTTTMPAVELVRKFATERGTPGAQFDFVAFIEGDEFRGKAAFRDERAFLTTTNRPGITLLQPTGK
ncbi:MAG TPA: YiiX/YebB-like N1pC/P60 family cysteine hydrolase, partial [Candidatus Acidoferrum sp.]|nr:YiiX/YebB-like N1pC/P60 family cysteine hydrolase [Candidatus Acidoferrum sp.]